MTDYATLTEFKSALRIPDTVDDTELQAKLTAASRRVDQDTGRNNGIGFGVANSATSRIYRPRHESLLTVDDISTSVGLIVEVGRGSSWTTVDPTFYDLLPENAEAGGKAIETLSRVWGCWPLWGQQRIRVTATWGWPSVPDQIKAATILLASRLFRRRDSPEGVAGFGDAGIVRISRWDPDYTALIDAYVKDAK